MHCVEDASRNAPFQGPPVVAVRAAAPEVHQAAAVVEERAGVGRVASSCSCYSVSPRVNWWLLSVVRCWNAKVIPEPSSALRTAMPLA